MNGGGNNRSRNNSEGDGRVYEVIKPITKAGILGFQIIQTAGMLALAWLAWQGRDNWLGNIVPDAGIWVTLTLAFQFFMFLWIQKINVSKTAK